MQIAGEIDERVAAELSAQFASLEALVRARKALMSEIFTERISTETLSVAAANYRDNADAPLIAAIAASPRSAFSVAAKRARRELRLFAALSRLNVVGEAAAEPEKLRRAIVAAMRKVYGAYPPFYDRFVGANETENVYRKEKSDKKESDFQSENAEKSERKTKTENAFPAKTAERLSPANPLKQDFSSAPASKALSQSDQSSCKPANRLLTDGNDNSLNAFTENEIRISYSERSRQFDANGEQSKSPRVADSALSESALVRANAQIRERVAALKREIVALALSASPSPSLAPLALESLSDDFRAADELYARLKRDFDREMERLAARGGRVAEPLERIIAALRESERLEKPKIV